MNDAAGLNVFHPQIGPTFVADYIDDILVFSENFDDHLHHLH